MDDIGKFEFLSKSELAWLDQRRQQLHAYIADLVPDAKTNAINSELLDKLWNRWRNLDVGDSEAALSFVQSFGVGFGDLLQVELEFEWMLLTDEFGTDFAVRALPGTGNTRVVPIEFVHKRYESDEASFVAHSLSEIERILERHKKEWSDTGAA